MTAWGKEKNQTFTGSLDSGSKTILIPGDQNISGVHQSKAYVGQMTNGVLTLLSHREPSGTPNLFCGYYATIDLGFKPRMSS